MFEGLVAGLVPLARPEVIGYMLLGNLIGVIFGVIPGLGGVQGLTVVLPFTFTLPPVYAMYLYAGIMGSVGGAGAVTAILINTPGTAPNVTATLDGYPMSLRGEAVRAISMSTIAGIVGVCFGLVILILLIPLVRAIVLSFGPPEVFWTVMFGIFCLALASRDNVLKGFAAAGVAFMLAFVGYADIFDVPRFTLGFEYLWDGLPLVPFFLGVFAIPQVFDYMSRRDTIAKGGEKIYLGGWDQMVQGAKDVAHHMKTVIRSSTIGMIVGIIPGVGGVTAAFGAYMAEVRASKDPSRFGKGEPAGLIASDATIHADVVGDLLPTVAFGVPGSVQMAVLLGALILHGLEPGPLLLTKQPEIVWALILGLALSQVLSTAMLFGSARWLGKITVVPVPYVGPALAVLTALGSFAVRGNVWDIMIMLLAGVLAWGLRRYGFPLASFGIGFVLADILERAFQQSLMIDYGSYAIFFNRPIALGLFLLLVATVLVSTLRKASRPPAPEKGIIADESSSAKPKGIAKFGAVLFYLFLLAVVLAMIWASLSMPYRARQLPLLIAVPTALLLGVSILIELNPGLIRRFQRRSARTFYRDEKEGEAPSGLSDLPPFRGFLIGGAWVALMFVLVLSLGFLAATLLFVPCFLWLFARYPWWQVSLYTGILFVVEWVGCDILLGLSLWPGAVPQVIPHLLGGGVLPPFL
ncbi:MAG TPA: tripartite tricarboxylate transporter permease [Terriglobales bacterium]|nr:tripartite tricarboxylate transporter permease [Terriglobales bacterium]